MLEAAVSRLEAITSRLEETEVGTLKTLPSAEQEQRIT
jgi:hypothetical protein